MAISSTQVFKLAEDLLENSEEVYIRASASRSFYAAYYAIKPLFDDLYSGPDLVGGTHEIIIDFFQFYQGTYGAEFSRKINQIGITMHGLRIIRTRADYNTGGNFSKNLAEQALKTGKNIERFVIEAYELKNKHTA